MPANTEIAEPVPSSGEQVTAAYPIVLRFKGMAPDLIHRFVLHDGRSGGDLSHVDLAAARENHVLHGRPAWHEKVKQRIHVLRHANHQEEIRAQLAKHRVKAADQIRLDGPSDPWRPSREGPMREGILTAHKSFFGSVGRNAWDEAFRQRALEFLQQHFPGDQLFYVTAHEDEESFHLHFVVAVSQPPHRTFGSSQSSFQSRKSPAEEGQALALLTLGPEQRGPQAKFLNAIGAYLNFALEVISLLRIAAPCYRYGRVSMPDESAELRGFVMDQRFCVRVCSGLKSSFIPARANGETICRKS